MIRYIAGAFALIAGIIGSGWPAPTMASRVELPSGCPATTSARVPTGTTLVLTVPKARDTAAEDAGAVQLCLLTAAGRFTPLYHSLPSGDVAVSADRHLLAYRDASYRLHLLRLPGDTDRVVGRGVLPQFSHDGHYLAFVTSDTLPLPTSPERLVTYTLASGVTTRIGPLTLPRIGGWLNLYSWAPHADTLAWSAAPGQAGDVRVVTIDRRGPRAIGTLIDRGLLSKLGWSADGSSLLYWRITSKISTQSTAPARFSLMRWHLPHGPAETVAASVPVRFFEDVLPAPMSDAGGVLFASLLGTPGNGLNQIILYARGHESRVVSLPGEPRLVSFAPEGSQFLAIWTPPSGQGMATHAALIDAATGHVQELGAASGAFWIGGTVS